MASESPETLRIERKPKLSERVVTVLREQILGGRIAAGEKLPTEGQLTGTFGVSRTVIREAMASLAADGLVEPRQGAGVFVLDRPAMAFSSITFDIGNKVSHALNVLEVRMGLEIESAGLAALRRSAAQDAAIQEAYFEFDRLLTIGEATGRKDFDFHLAIAAATNNPFYVEVFEALGMRAIPCDITSPWSADSELTRDYQMGLQAEHMAIMRAISAGDAEAARAAMRAHLVASEERYRQRLSDQQAGHRFASRGSTKPDRTDTP